MSMLSRFATFGGGGDPYWANVSYLLVGNGANGTTTNIKDSSSNNVSTTITGNTVISTAQSKYGSGSVYFDGSGDQVTANSASVLNFGTANYTVECWVFLPDPTATQTILRDNASGGFALMVIGSHFALVAAGIVEDIVGTTTLSANTWYYVAISRSSGTSKLYVGTTSTAPVDGSTTTSRNYPGPTPAYIGGHGGEYMTGYLYDLRVTKNVARYTGSSTTVPTAAFPTS